MSSKKYIASCKSKIKTKFGCSSIFLPPLSFTFDTFNQPQLSTFRENSQEFYFSTSSHLSNVSQSCCVTTHRSIARDSFTFWLTHLRRSITSKRCVWHTGKWWEIYDVCAVALIPLWCGFWLFTRAQITSSSSQLVDSETTHTHVAPGHSRMPNEHLKIIGLYGDSVIIANKSRYHVPCLCKKRQKCVKCWWMNYKIFLESFSILVCAALWSNSRSISITINQPSVCKITDCKRESPTKPGDLCWRWSQFFTHSTISDKLKDLW